MMRLKATLTLLVLLAALPLARAVTYEFSINMSGAEEVPPGDPDGSGVGKLWINSATNLISWDFVFSDILLPLSGFHIHNAPAGSNGGVVVNFGGMASGSLVDADAQAILADPTQYYLNAHTSEFPAGAVRGQLPREARKVPDSGSSAMALLAALGAFALFRRFSRR